MMLYNLPTREDFTFYPTFDSDSLTSYMPETPVLLPASSWARKGLSTPRIPSHLTDKAADSGGFVASKFNGGVYRYTLAQYVQWLRSWSPRWAATMDLCCEPELSVITRERQDTTTQNTIEAWTCYRDVMWCWVPTIQGLYPEDYRRHAEELKPLIEEMRAYYASNPAWRVGVGTLCRRNDVTIVQAILSAVREVLPGVPLHLWGIKLDALRSINLEQVVSTDSAVWHGSMYARDQIAEASRLAGMSMRRYKILVNLPEYTRRVHRAVEESARVHAAQNDTLLLSRAKAVLKLQGWSISVRTRNNRSYVYGARHRAGKFEQRTICPVSGLAAWLLCNQPAQLFG